VLPACSHREAWCTHRSDGTASRPPRCRPPSRDPTGPMPCAPAYDAATRDRLIREDAAGVPQGTASRGVRGQHHQRSMDRPGGSGPASTTMGR
jgi:hypothetical protein